MNPTIEEYVQGVEDTIQYWLNCHTQAEQWAERWSMDDIEYAFKESPILSNNYFYFEWKSAALKRHARHTKYDKCKNCGCLCEEFYSDCCESPRMKPAKVYEIEEWLKEIDFTPSADDLEESLIKDGFKAYREGVKDYTKPVEAECRLVLKAIRKAKTPEDKLSAVLWGTRVYHVHGNIMQDYGDGFISYNLIDSIRNNGLNSVFSAEEINEYLNS